MDKITLNHNDFDLSETQIELFPQSSCKKEAIHKTQADSSTNLTVFQPLSFRNLKMFPQLMVA